MLAQNKRPPKITEYVNAASLDQALAALADGTGTVLAGGSDLWAQKDSGAGRLAGGISLRLVNLNRVPELHGIDARNGVFRLGALCTVSEVIESDLLAEKLPVLAATGRHFASDQIRNVATIGGNIANASPAADMVVSLIALDAVVKIRSQSRGTRRLALGDLLVGPGRTRLQADELIVAVEIPTPTAGFHAVFVKSGPRPALEISRVAMCLAGDLHGETLSNPRLVFGAVGATALRCAKTEAMIDGQPLDDALIAGALDIMAGEIAPIDDFRASRWYRTRMAKTFLEQELNAWRSK